jgi:autotransporter-associated beta strand protein
MATWTGSVNSNWSNAGNWSGGILPSATEGASISAANVTVDATGLTASLVSVFINRTVTVGFGGGLTVGGAFEVFSGSSLVVREGGSVSAGSYSIAGNLVIGGTGAATTGGTVTGAVNLSAAGGKLTFNTTGTFVFSNVISGSGSVEQKGSLTVTLSGANTYTGATTVSAGTLELSGGSAIANAGAVLVNGSGTLRVLASETIGSLAGSGSVILSNGVTLTVGDSTNATFSGVLSSSNGGLAKIGDGKLTLSGANSFFGNTTVNAGVLAISNATALGDTTRGARVEAGAALEISGGITVGSEALELIGSGITSGGALRNVSGTNGWNGAISTTGAETRINSDAGQLTLAGGISGFGTLTLGGSGNITVSSAITVSGGLTKDGNGTVRLSGANTYTGVTTVNSGTLELAGANIIPDLGEVVVNANGILRLFIPETIGSLGGQGAVFLDTLGKLTVGGDNTNKTFSGVISGGFGSGSLTKTGTGSLELSGVNIYGGETVVSAGVLAISNAAALGSTAANSFTTVEAGAALQLNGSILFNAEFLTLKGTGIANGGALQSFSGNNTWSGAITLGSEARINAQQGSLTLTGGITGNNHNLILGVITDATPGTLTVDSAINLGTGSLTKDGSGTAILSGANAFTGATTVNAGLLRLTASNSIGNASAVVVQAPGTLEMLADKTIGSLAGSGNVVLLNGSDLTTGGDNFTPLNTVFSGVISADSGNSRLEKTGIGTFTLGGINTYTDVTFISGGTLALSGVGSIALSSELIFSGFFGGRTFDISGLSAASTVIRDVNFQSTGTIILGGKTLDVTNALGTIGTGTIRGGAGVDGLNFTMAATGTVINLSGLTFDTWAGSTDKVRISGNALDNIIVSSSQNDIIDGGAGTDGVIYSGSYKILAGSTASDLTISTSSGIDRLINVENVSINNTLIPTATLVQQAVPLTFGGPITGIASFGRDLSAGGWSSDTRFHRELADVNGDGRADIIGFGGAATFVSLANSDGSGTFGNPFSGINSFGFDLSAGGWSDNDSFPRTLGDVNGDGRADIIGFGGAATFVALAKSDGSGTFNNPIVGINSFGRDLSAGGWSSDNIFHRELADVNGDGREDIVGFGGAATFVALAKSDGSGAFNNPIVGIASFGFDLSAGGWTNNDRFPRTLADVNGDGKADIIGFGGAGVFVALAKADGSGTFNSPIVGVNSFGFDLSAGGWSSDNIFHREVVDVNGDGRADIIGFGGAGTFMALAKADNSGTFSPAFLAVNAFGNDPAAGGWVNNDLFPRTVADVTGEGFADIVGFGGAGTFVSASNWFAL